MTLTCRRHWLLSAPNGGNRRCVTDMSATSGFVSLPISY